MGRTCTDGPDELEPSKFDCNYFSWELYYVLCSTAHSAAFHQGLHCLLFRETNYIFFWEGGGGEGIITFGYSISFTMVFSEENRVLLN